jgi:hypothetical protein
VHLIFKLNCTLADTCKSCINYERVAETYICKLTSYLHKTVAITCISSIKYERILPLIDAEGSHMYMHLSKAVSSVD